MARLRDMIGQEAAIQLLERAVLARRISHAYLFAGPRGTGRRTAAIALALAANCEAQGHDACLACDACRRILAGSHPDVIVVEPDGATLKIEQIRRLQSWASLRAYTAPQKFAILCSAEKMTGQAANSLLKLLEEPAGGTSFVLICEQSSQILPTIRSRCQVIPFQLAPAHLIEGALLRRGWAETHAKSAAAMALGRPARVLGQDEETLKGIRDDAIEWARALTQEPVGRLLAKASRFDANKEHVREDADLLLDRLMLWFRDLLVWKTAGDAKLVAHADVLPEIQKQADAVSVESLHHVLNSTKLAKEALHNSGNVRLAVDAWLVRCKRLGA